jgi:hypothetical protein
MVLDKDALKQVGSCVLIGNKYVLSAGHVFTEREMRPDTIYLDKNGKHVDKMEQGGRRVVVNQQLKTTPAMLENYMFRFNRRLYRGKQFKIYQPYLDSVDHKNYFCGDLAIIELEDTVAEISPAIFGTSFDEKYATVTGVGFGVSGPGDKPEEAGTFMEKIAGENVIDSIDGYKVNGQPTYLSFDFDHPTRTDCNKMGSSKPLPLEWCPGGGDSGGGLFKQNHGQWYLIGIITGGPRSGIDLDQFEKSGFYGHIGQCTRLSVFVDWIVETIEIFQKTKYLER